MLQRQWRESSGHFGRHLKVYQIHSATFDSGVLDNVEVLDKLARLKCQGIAIGLTLSGVDQAEVLRPARRIVWDGEPLFGCVQATWSLLEPSAGPALAEARAAGMGVISKEALANGRLTSRNVGASFTGEGGTLRREAERLGVGMDALALAAGWPGHGPTSCSVERSRSSSFSPTCARSPSSSIPRRWEPLLASPRIQPATGGHGAD